MSDFLLRYTSKCNITASVLQADEEKAKSKPPVSAAAVPKLLAKSGTMRLLFIAYLSAGYSTSFASGTFTADAAARSLGVLHPSRDQNDFVGD